MTSPRRAVVGLLAAALISTTGAVAGQSAAAAPTAVTAADRVQADVSRTSAPKLTARDKRLASKQRCGKRQWRRTPVRCQRIKLAKAKVRAHKKRAPVVTPPGPVVRPPSIPDSRPFTVAVIPDTQQEVFGSDGRMTQRSQWLVNQRESLNLKFVNHIGDVTNWGWLDSKQFSIASAGMRPLEQAGIPYSLSLGNHDTGAVGWDGQGNYGGGAYVSNPECLVRLSVAACKTGLLVRRTQEFNDVFNAQRFGAVRGAFERGKVDNTYSTFEAGGRDWMVLNLELWPRAAAVSWAKSVVAAHPRHNVIVSTHAYLDGDGAGISGSAGYGSTSPRYLWDNLVSQYANIKVVLSGHVGSGAVRFDTGREGNRVVSLLQAFHSNEANPVRLLRVDPVSGTIETRVISPNGRGGDFSRHTRTLDGLQFVG